jgi:hypothetical protein
VVQLQLLDLMIPKECGAVPTDAATRAHLIDSFAAVSLRRAPVNRPYRTIAASIPLLSFTISNNPTYLSP